MKSPLAARHGWKHRRGFPTLRPPLYRLGCFLLTYSTKTAYLPNTSKRKKPTLQTRQKKKPPVGRQTNRGDLFTQQRQNKMNKPRNPAGIKNTTPAPLRAGNVLHLVEIPRSLDGHRVNNRAALSRLLVLLGGVADHDTGRESRASLATLAERLQASARTVQRALATLERLGLILRTRAHSWRLHRPTTWAIAPDVLRAARLLAMQAVKDRASAYWAKVRAWAVEHYKRLPVASGRQVCVQPSPLQGERGKEGKGEGREEVGKAPPGALLDILRHLSAPRSMPTSKI